MPQYTSTVTSSLGVLTVTTVIDTEANTQTITVTTSGGQTATATQTSSTRPNGSTIDSLETQLRAAGARDLNATDLGGAARSSYNRATQEAQKAEVAATATNTEVPNNPSPPPPVTNKTDPEVPPPAAQPSTVEPSAPEPVVATNTDPFEQARLDAQQRVDQESPTSQAVINAEEDPFEKARLEKAQRTTDQAPTAQAVINAEDDPFEKARLEKAQKTTDAAPNEQDVLSGAKGTTAAETNTRTQATQQDEANFKQSEDWRVRLSLAPESKYLYNVEGAQGILAPLAATDGILFPYTPNIQVTYAASYEAPDVAHTNYKIYQYKNSSVDNIQISCDFTAQDTFEANYLLAVIHFLRSITKMFYGQDQNPKPGVPPPLCYLTGLGAFQFDAHPLAVTNFTYNLPIDVDYIRAGTTTTNAGVNKSSERSPDNSGTQLGQRSTGVGPGATVPAPKFKNVPGGTIEPTYVPTKMQIQISAIPIITRNNISNNFSLKDYATGKLLQGSQTRRGGMW